MLPRFGHLAVKSKIGPKIQRTAWFNQTLARRYTSLHLLFESLSSLPFAEYVPSHLPPTCGGDLNNDVAISVGDILLMLGQFGNICN